MCILGRPPETAGVLGRYSHAMKNGSYIVGAFARSWRRPGALAAVIIAALALVTTAPLALSHARGGDFTGPPPATGHAGTATVPLGLGSFCWTDPGAEVGLCADTIGIITDPTALTAPVGSLVTVAYPSGITEVFVRASPLPGEPIQDDGATLAWAPQDEGQELSVHLRPGAFGFFADLAAGQYLVTIFLFVPEGDVSYGLILDVSADGQGSPDALPATGSGGLADSDGGTLTWVWALVAVAAVATVVVSGRRLSSR